MLSFSLFLHFYQPSTQFPEVLDEVSRSSYLPVLEILSRTSHPALTVNIGGTLLDQWAQSSHQDLINGYKKIIDVGLVEVVGSAKFHPILPKLPASEIRRQITLQEQALKKYLGIGKPAGFFPPEMAFDRDVAGCVSDLGYNWILVDESASLATPPDSLYTSVETIAGSNLKVFFRNPKISHAIAFSEITTLEDFQDLIQRFKSGNGYFILGMDAETFGWHRPEQLKLLKGLLEANQAGTLGADLVPISQLAKTFPAGRATDPTISTWGESTSPAVGSPKVFPRWDNPASELHRRQWELLNLALAVSVDAPQESPARKFLDMGVQSDQFWWASGNPCWHPLMVTRGSQLLLESIEKSVKTTDSQKRQAELLCSEIDKIGRIKYGNKPVAC